jgi:hypothetical protein
LDDLSGMELDYSIDHPFAVLFPLFDAWLSGFLRQLPTFAD